MVSEQFPVALIPGFTARASLSLLSVSSESPLEESPQPLSATASVEGRRGAGLKQSEDVQ